jgi:flagellar biosynthesis anti-sigma factor FlgM
MDIKNPLNSSLYSSGQRDPKLAGSSPDSGRAVDVETAQISTGLKNSDVTLSNARAAKSSEVEYAVDAQKIEQIKQAIALGAYRIDPQKIAQSLIDFELLQKPRA